MPAKPADQSPPVQGTPTEGGFGSEERTGYSESAPSRSIPLRRKDRDRKNDEKEEKKTRASKPVGDPIPAGENNEDVIRVETNLVTIPVSVSDRDGFYVAGLREANFKIFEDG